MAEEKLLLRITRDINSLPTLPEAYTTISQMLENPRVSASDVAEVISRDPALTARLLKVVNSAFYGLPQQVSTLTHALVLLGFSTVKSLILAMGLVDIFGESRSQRFKRPAFWAHCFSTGLIAKAIAVRVGHPQLEEIFIQGLLHDIGKIALDQYAPEEFETITAQVESRGILIREAEQEVLGFTHAEVGGLVADRWNLPPRICSTIEQHHQPHKAGDLAREAAMVHLADIVCRALQIGSGGDPAIPALSHRAWASLQLDWKALSGIMEEAASFADSPLSAFE